MAKVASPFIPLNLSHHEAHYLRELVHVFVQHLVETYERYVHDDQRCLDNKYWKQILHRDDMRVFSGRQCDKNEESCECSDCINQQKSSELTSLPTLLTVGHMEGSLDDAMYGMMTPTVAAMRLKNFYTEDHMAKGAVLVTIDKPSATDPFRSLDVKWVESYQPPMLRSIISNRDFVYMEATGFTELRDGEMVGYRIVHSVHFPQTPKVGNNIRGNMSTCGLYRQRYHNTVEVYIRASLNSGGYAPRSYAVKYASIALISARKMIRCAHRKKLSWLLGQCDATVILGEAKCIGCGQKPGIFATYIGSCALCKRALCSPCRIKIEVGYVTLRGSLVKKKMWFCTYCLDEARQTSSRVVALEEYVGTRLVASIPWSCSPTQSSTASVLDRSDD